MKIIKPKVTLEWITPRAAYRAETAGRTCYRTEGKAASNGSTAKAFLKARLIGDNPHESVIEHAVASFRIITDRGISHELVRHRLASFSQESTRYCNYSNNRFDGSLQFLRPANLPPELGPAWERAVKSSEIAYLILLAGGAKPQDARSILPNCLKTELVMTCNMREWRHFLKLRLAEGAHPDMRIIAHKIATILVDKAPEFFPEPIYWCFGKPVAKEAVKKYLANYGKLEEL